MTGFEEYYEEVGEPSKREKAYAWATAVGLQDVDGLKPSKYLLSPVFYCAIHKFLFQDVFEHAGEFRTVELRNRYLHVLSPYGSKRANALAGKHRGDIKNFADVGVNVGVNPTEELAIKAFLRAPKTSATELAVLLKITKRQAERVIASLKKKVGLKRRGACKNGEWYFESGEQV